MKKKILLGKSLVFPTTLLIVWEIIVRSGLVPPSQSAAPSNVFLCLIKLVYSGTILNHTLYSLERLLLGVFIGIVLGILTSIFLANSIKADKLFSPTIQLFAGVPVVLWMPFCVMFFGTGELFKISLAALSTYFLVHVLAFHSIRSTEKDYLELANIYERSYWERVWEIQLPSATRAIFAAIRTALVLVWIILFFVEYASSERGKEGLGWYIADSRSMGRIEEEFAGLFLLAIIAFIIDSIANKIQKSLLKWSASSDSTLINKA